MFRQSMKRAIFNISMYVAIILMIVILLRAIFSFKVLDGNSDVLYIISIPMAMSGFTPFACLFPILPYSFSFSEEFNSGYIKSILIRSGYNKYIVVKLISTGISGGLLMTIGFGVIFLIAGIAGKPTTPENISQFYEGTIWLKYAFVGGGQLVLILKLALAFLFGIVWAEMGLLVTSIFPNRYIAFVVPFVIYQLAWNLFGTSVVNPLFLLRGDFAEYKNLLQPISIQVVIISFICLCIYNLLKRKIKYV